MNQFKFNSACQKGQALLYIFALLVPLAMGAAYVYNSFGISNEKTRLQNTTDAVAYSVATVEARDLNFKAYTNRAMVANQVAIAQAVGLVSWTRFASNAARNLAAVTSWIPWLNAVTRAFSQIMANVERVVERVVPIYASAVDAVITVLSASQRAMHVATTAVAADTMREVIRANDPSVDSGITLSNAAMMANYIRNHNRFTRRFSPETVRRNGRSRWGRRSETYRQHFDRVEEFREITMESRDGFSQRRTYRYFSINVMWALRFEMRRAGGTELTGEDSRHRYGSWIAMDTMSWHRRTRGCGTFGNRWCRWRETIPIGWGAAKNARRQERVSFWDRHNRQRNSVGSSWRQNRWASSLAASRFQNAREVEVQQYGGLRDYFDLHHDGLIQKAPGIRILLTKPRNSFRTADQIGYNDGGMSIENGADMARTRMAAMAEATPYFARINDRGRGTGSYRRSDGLREYGNLYNPYWQARLESMSEREKRQTQLAAGVL